MNRLLNRVFRRRRVSEAIFSGSFQIALLAFALSAKAQTPPPAPSLVSPLSGAALVQPISLVWNPVTDPDGPIGSYLWQVGTSSTFSTVIAEGFQNMSLDAIPVPTQDKVSGLPNGTYFWRVKATQMVGGAVGSIESAWSQVRSFIVTGLGPAPTAPGFTSPANGKAFHAVEFFDITWNAVAGAHYYLLEADDEPSFSHPLTLTTDSMQFGTRFHAGWGNEIPNVYYRVRAVSADNVRGLPSPTLNVHIVNSAPVPPAPALLSPIAGASVSLPILFDWSDTANPQIAGYDLDIDDEPNFLGTFGVVLVQNISRSDYLLAEDQDLHLAPETYFWRVRAVHGSVSGPWSAGGSFRVVAPPPTPAGLKPFWIIAEPGSVSGGNPTQARVTLNMPAGPGGAVVRVASDLPHAQAPTSVTIPEGKTDGWVSPITTVPVSGATIGTLRAAYGGAWQQSSLGLWPILWGVSLSDESVVGGDLLTGTVTLLNPAPPGGVEVTLVSGDTDLVAPPAKVSIPAGGTGATFNIETAPVSVPIRIIIDSGTALEGYRAPANWLTLMPAGSPPPPPSLADMSLSSASVVAEGNATGTVTLTGPAPAGGALVRLSGSMEGEVVVPPNVTVPAGSISASFPITAPQVNARRYVLIQASYGTAGGTQARLLQINPAAVGHPALLAMVVEPFSAIGGTSLRGTVGLSTPAPAGGGIVALSSDNPAVVPIPASAAVAAGNSANSFTIPTRPVTVSTPVRIDATAGGVTKSFFIYLGPDPNAPPLLLSLTLSVSSVTGGNSVSGTVFLNGSAPAGGASVTLATSKGSVAQAPPVVQVPAGQGSANFTLTTFPVSANTPVSVTAFYGNSTQSANLTVMAGSSPPPTPDAPSLLNPANGSQPAQPITLDWNDVSNAASYEIQVDDSSSFTAPLVRSLTSTASQTSVTGLPAVQHWWRVRAKNSAGTAGNWSASRRFTPLAPPAASSLSTLVLNPTAVVGGNPSQGTVTLTTAAPTGGALIVLNSSNPSVAAVPANVTVPAGSTSATFNLTSSAVTTSTSVTLTASYNSLQRTATLTVNPAQAGPLPAPSLVGPGNDARFQSGQAIVFDWSDVASAAGYTLQIDDRNTFPVPLILSQSTVASTFTTSSLARADMWWRVRANDSAGNPGTWSAARRFRVE